MKKIILFLLLFTPSLFAEEYRIILHRPLTVGDRFQVQINFQSRTTMLIETSGQPSRNEENSYEIELSGVQTIVEVDKDKAATKVALKVDRCIKKEGESQTNILQNGDEIVIWKEDRKTILQLNGKTVDEKMADILKNFVSVHEEGKPLDDEIFGNSGMVKVGQEWQINNRLAAADLSEAGLEISPDKVNGTIRLNGIVEEQGEKYQDISAKVSILDIRVPVPAELKTENAEMNVELSGLFPLDPTKEKIAENLSMNLNYSASGLIEREGVIVPVKFVMETSEKKSVRSKKL